MEVDHSHFGPPRRVRGSQKSAATPNTSEEEEAAKAACVRTKAGDEVASKAISDLLNELEQIGMEELEKQMHLTVSFWDMIHILKAAFKAEYGQSDLAIVTGLIDQVKSLMQGVIKDGITDGPVALTVKVDGQDVVTQFDGKSMKDKLTTEFERAPAPNPKTVLAENAK